MCAEGLTSERQCIDVCVNISAGILDGQETIQKEVLGTFHEMWVLKKRHKVEGGHLDRADLVIKVASSRRAAKDLLVEILERLLREFKETRKAFKEICTEVKKKLLELKEDDSNYLPKLEEYSKTFMLFCDTDSSLLVEHTKFVQPYLDSLMTDLPKDKIMLKMRSDVMASLLEVLRQTIPAIQPPYGKLFESLVADLKKIIRCEDMSVLRAAVPCICAVAKKEEKHVQSAQRIFRVFLNFLIKETKAMKANGTIPDNKRKTVIRSMYCLGLLVKNFDFTSSDMPNPAAVVFKILIEYCKGGNPLFKRIAIQGLFHIFTRDPDLMSKSFSALSSFLAAEPKMQITALRGFAEFLQGEDDLVYKIQKQESTASLNPNAEEDSEIPKREDDTTDSVIPTIMQHHLKAILRLFQSKNADVRFQALKVVFQSLRMGLINPFQCIPSAICLLTDENKDVNSDALRLILFFNEKRPKELRNRAINGIEACFNFQRALNPNFDPFSRDAFSDTFFGGLSRLYALVAQKREDRNSFLKAIIDAKIKNGILSANEKKRKSQAAGLLPKKVAFLCTILANLNYDYDEPLLIIFYINKILGTEGSQLYEFVKNSVDKEDTNVKIDDIKGSQLSIFSVLIKLQQFLKDAYQLTDAKCETWTPYLSNKAATQKAGRKLELVEFLLYDIPQPGKDSSNPQPGKDSSNPNSVSRQIAYFLEGMEKESIQLQASYKKKPRRRSKKKKNYVESQEDEDTLGLPKDKEDDDWVPGRQKRLKKGN